MTQPTGWQTGIERKRDWARDAEQVFWLGAAVVTGWAAWQLAGCFIGNLAVQVPASALGITAAAGAIPAGAQLSAVDDHVTVLLTDPTMGQRLLAVLAAVPQSLVLAVVLALLARWARSVRRGATFTAAAAARLTRVGQFAASAGAAAFVCHVGFAGTLSWGARPPDVVGGFTLASLISSLGPALWWPICGACLGLVGEVVRRGVALRDELEGVI
jgi:hypothetical protein